MRLYLTLNSSPLKGAKLYNKAEQDTINAKYPPWFNKEGNERSIQGESDTHYLVGDESNKKRKTGHELVRKDEINLIIKVDKSQYKRLMQRNNEQGIEQNTLPKAAEDYLAKFSPNLAAKNRQTLLKHTRFNGKIMKRYEYAAIAFKEGFYVEGNRLHRSETVYFEQKDITKVLLDYYKFVLDNRYKYKDLIT